MARYIDESKLIQAIIKERDKIPLTRPCASYELLDEKPSAFGQAQRSGIRKALRCIAETPTADVVEVRCKDCQYGYCEDKNVYTCRNFPDGLGGYVDGECFCSYGERRES